jgi:hypothetical protein
MGLLDRLSQKVFLSLLDYSIFHPMFFISIFYTMLLSLLGVGSFKSGLLLLRSKSGGGGSNRGGGGRKEGIPIENGGGGGRGGSIGGGGGSRLGI